MTNGQGRSSDVLVEARERRLKNQFTLDPIIYTALSLPELKRDDVFVSKQGSKYHLVPSTKTPSDISIGIQINDENNDKVKFMFMILTSFFNKIILNLNTTLMILKLK